MKRLLFSARRDGSERVGGTENPEASVLFGSPNKDLQFESHRAHNAFPKSPAGISGARQNLSHSDSGALFAKFLTETRKDERICDRDIVSDFIDLFSMEETDEHMVRQFVMEGIPGSFETFVCTAEKKWAWFKLHKSNVAETIKAEEGLILRDSLQDHLLHFRSSSGASAITVFRMALFHLTQFRGKTAWLKSEKASEKKSAHCSARAVQWVHQFAQCDYANLDTTLVNLSLGKESAHLLDFSGSIDVPSSPGAQLLSELVRENTVASTKILAAITISLINYVGEEKILDLDPHSAYDSYFIRGRLDHPSCMPSNGSQTASQWLAQDDSTVRDLSKTFRAAKMTHLEITLDQRKAQLKEASSTALWNLIIDSCEEGKYLWDEISYPGCRELLLDAQDSLDRKLKNNQNRRLKAPQKTPQKTSAGPQDSSAAKPQNQTPRKDKDKDKTVSSGSKDTRWEVAEKACPPGADLNDHLRRAARGHIQCGKQNLEGGCSFGEQCQFRHTNEVTAGQKYVMEVNLSGKPPSSKVRKQFAEAKPDEKLPEPLPKQSPVSAPKSVLEVPKADPATVVSDDDEDDDGFQIYHPKKTIYFDSRVKQNDGPKPVNMIVTDRPFLSTPLEELTPGTRDSEVDFRLRMSNKFEPNGEVANLLRSGTMILPEGSQRSAKGIPADEWVVKQQKNVSAHPGSYVPTDMQLLMTMDVGSEMAQALEDSDLDLNDSVELDSDPDEEIKNIHLLAGRRSGNTLITDYMFVKPPAPAVQHPVSLQIPVHFPCDSPIMDVEDAGEYLISTNSDFYGLCGCSSLPGNSENECVRCFQCEHCCDCMAQHHRLIKATGDVNRSPSSMFSFLEDFDGHDSPILMDSDDSDDSDEESNDQILDADGQESVQDFGIARRR